eukprot:1544546-Pyramimonas_sp.AAC.1
MGKADTEHCWPMPPRDTLRLGGRSGDRQFREGAKRGRPLPEAPLDGPTPAADPWTYSSDALLAEAVVHVVQCCGQL